ASFVGTAGLTSMQTDGIVAGNKLPVATACNVEATSKASPIPGIALRMVAWASSESVITPGNGPSSRIVPAMTTSAPRLTQAAIIPVLTTPDLTAASMLPMALIRLIVQMVL